MIYAKINYYCKFITIIFILFFTLSCASNLTSLDDPIANSLSTTINSLSKIKIDLFVMSQCPYAMEAERAIIPLIKKIKEKVEFGIYYIAEENNTESRNDLKNFLEKLAEVEEQNEHKCQGNAFSEGGKFKSLHGKSEIEEDIRQLVIAKYYPENYLDYLLFRSENYSSEIWEESAVRAWIDCELISRIAQSEEGEELLRKNIQKSNELKIRASPTLLINGKQYKSQITKNAMGRMICKERLINELCEFIPVCGTDFDCNALGKVGICLNPDTPQAACKFREPVKFELTLIKPKKSKTCGTDYHTKWLKNLFPGMQIKEIEENTDEANKSISVLNIKILPAFYFSKNINQTARYNKIKEKLYETKDGFLLNPDHLNISYLLGRKEKKAEIKLFIESLSPKAIVFQEQLILDGFMEKENVDIHFVAGRVDDKNSNEIEVLTAKRDQKNPSILYLAPKKEMVIFKSPKGLREIQEDIRQLCINKYYPDEYSDYFICIKDDLLKNEGIINWKACLLEDIDHTKIEACTNGYEGMKMLLNDIALIEEWGISQGPAFLINNKYLLRDIDPFVMKTIYNELTQ